MIPLFFCFVSLLTGGLLAAAMGSRPRAATLFGLGGAVVGCSAGLLAAFRGFFGGYVGASFAWKLPGASFSCSVDPLSAFFLLPVLGLSLLCAIYGAAYMEPNRIGLHWFFYNLLVASMAAVVTAANALLFLIAWELMSLASFFLVSFDHRSPQVRRAGWVYLVATHLGTSALFGLFLLAGGICGGFDFARFGTLAGVSPERASLLLLLAVVGFGTKAGLFPVHVWLPEAHPAAPSHVSALMSGVMIKTGIYGILRVLSFLPPVPPWWGWVLMILGILGGLFGIALAGLQTDIKRSLAYSTVENVGLIFLALGTWISASAAGAELAASLALLGGLLHVWNHAIFKGLLFLGAGALLHGTGTRELSRMGGLLRRMPLTATLIIVGAAAVAALPPFNGFAGEWMMYMGLLGAGESVGGFSAFIPFLLAGLLALVGGMTAVVFTRIVGIGLLGEPRHRTAANAHEVRGAMLWPMAILGTLCLVLGLWPGIAIGPAMKVAALFLSPGALEGTAPAAMLGSLGTGGLMLIIFVAVLSLVFRWRTGVRTAPPEATWGCGYAFPTSRMAYTASGFTEPAQSILPPVLRSAVFGGRPRGMFPAPESFRVEAPDPVATRIVAPISERLVLRAGRFRRLQAGWLNAYLLYIFVTLALFMIWLAYLQERMG